MILQITKQISDIHPRIKVQATSRESLSSQMYNSVIHVEFKRYTLRYQYISPLQSERDRIHCPSFHKLHSNLFTDACLRLNIWMLYQFHKMSKTILWVFRFEPCLTVCVKTRYTSSIKCLTQSVHLVKNYLKCLAVFPAKGKHERQHNLQKIYNDEV